MAEVEIYYGLHGGVPILIGAGSLEDIARIGAESDMIDTQTDTESLETMNPSTAHFYRALGEIAGVAEVTDAVLEHYTGLVEASKATFIQRLRGSLDPSDTETT